MSAWKDDEEEVPPSKIALKMVNVLVSVICGWYVRIGCWGPHAMVVVCGIFYFTLHVLHYMYFILVLREMMVCGTSGVNLFFCCLLLHFVASTFCC